MTADRRKNPLLLCLFLSAVYCLLATPSESPAQQDYPNREILRPLVLPTGFGEFTGGVSWLSTNRAFDNGRDKSDMGSDFTEFVYSMGLAAGLFENIELRVSIPYVQRELDTDFGDEVVEGFGDLDATMLYQVFRQVTGRTTSVALGARGIFPIGESEIGDDLELALKPPARGAWAVGAIIWIREAYTRNLGFLYTFEWDFYLDGEQKFIGVTADTDYGDIMRTSVEPTIQLTDHLALWASIVYTIEFESTLDVQGITVAKYDDSDLLEVRPAIEIQFGHTMDIFVGTSWRTMGKNAVAGWPIWAKLEIRF